MTEPTKSSRKPWVFGALIIAVLSTALLLSRYLVSNPPMAERQPQERTARLVEAQAVEAQAAVVSVAGYGVVEAAQMTTLASRVSGEVIELAAAFTPGAQVVKGQWLLRIDRSDYELALQEAQAALASAKAALAQEQGQQAVARADAQMLGLEVSEAERKLMLRQPQLARAQAEVDAAQAAVARAKLNLQRTEIVAPFDGLVNQRSVSVGTQLSSNTPLGELAAVAPYWVSVRLPVESLRWLEWPQGDNMSGSSVTLNDAADPDGPSWQGRVLQLLPGLETEGRRAGVLVQVDEPHAGHRPLLIDTYVEAQIQGRALEQAFKLDTTWIHDAHVWVIEQEQLRNQPVEIAYRANDYVLVTKGLNTGDRIVTSVPSGFVAGMKVRTADSALATEPRRQRGADDQRRGQGTRS